MKMSANRTGVTGCGACAVWVGAALGAAAALSAGALAAGLAATTLVASFFSSWDMAGGREVWSHENRPSAGGLIDISARGSRAEV